MYLSCHILFRSCHDISYQGVWRRPTWICQYESWHPHRYGSSGYGILRLNPYYYHLFLGRWKSQKILLKDLKFFFGFFLLAWKVSAILQMKFMIRFDRLMKFLLHIFCLFEFSRYLFLPQKKSSVVRMTVWKYFKISYLDPFKLLLHNWSCEYVIYSYEILIINGY